MSIINSNSFSLIKLVVVGLTADEIIELLEQRVSGFNPTTMVGESYLNGIGLYLSTQDQIQKYVINALPSALNDYSMVSTCQVGNSNVYLWKYVKAGSKDVKATQAAVNQASGLFK